MGLASITHQGNTFRFRTNPNSITWSYNLNKYVDETYGGRVVQLLSVNIDNLTVTAQAGRGGWDYLYSTVLFFRDMLVNQRDSGEPGVFEYANRGWKFSVYAQAMPFKDAVEEVAREFTMNFKVQEDVSGVATQQTMDAELAKLKEGIGYTQNEYNYLPGDGNNIMAPANQAASPGQPGVTTIVGGNQPGVTGVTTGTNQPGVTGATTGTNQPGVTGG